MTTLWDLASVNRQRLATLFGSLRRAPLSWPQQILLWVLYFICTYSFLRPAITTVVVADDLINPFNYEFRSLNDFLERSNGHFNYIGHLIGSLTFAFWARAIGSLGINFTLVYGITKFLIFVVSLLAIANASKRILHFAGGDCNLWMLRMFTLLVGAGFMQLHVPWSNDPVASYPVSGFLSAAVGYIFVGSYFWIIKSDSVPKSLLVGLIGVVATLMYEYNIFAVVGVVPIAIYGYSKCAETRNQLIKLIRRDIVAISPAIIVAVSFYARARNNGNYYAGTDISVDRSFMLSSLIAFTNSLPGAGWPRSEAWLWLQESPRYGFVSIPLVVVSVITSVATLTIVSVLSRGLRDGAYSRLSMTRLVIAGSPVLVYWLGSTLIQANTTKVKAEESGLGEVYLYYSVGALAVATFVAIGYLQFLQNYSSKRLRLISATVLVVLLAYQANVNDAIQKQFNRSFVPTVSLIDAIDGGVPMVERCTALSEWVAIEWPAYYEEEMLLGLNQHFHRYEGEPFCKP